MPETTRTNVLGLDDQEKDIKPAQQVGELAEELLEQARRYNTPRITGDRISISQGTGGMISLSRSLLTPRTPYMVLIKHPPDEEKNNRQGIMAYLFDKQCAIVTKIDTRGRINADIPVEENLTFWTEDPWGEVERQFSENDYREILNTFERISNYLGRQQ